MHKKRVQIKETPYGYTFMHKKHVQIKEGSRFMADLKQYFPMIQDRKEVMNPKSTPERLNSVFWFLCSLQFPGKWELISMLSFKSLRENIMFSFLSRYLLCQAYTNSYCTFT